MRTSSTSTDELIQAIRAAGLADVPERFGIAAVHQEIPQAVLAEIEAFIQMFDRVTGRESWQRAAVADAPAIARVWRAETCFFSAWDFHLPPGDPGGWQLIEFNDNGSGFLFAGLLNRLYCELSKLDCIRPIEVPLDAAALAERLIGMIRTQAEAYFDGTSLRGLIMILDDAESLTAGRFRNELAQLCELCRSAGWRAEVGAPADTTWDGTRLLYRDAPVGFVVNRSTDFLLEGPDMAALRSAYESQSVYVAPNPFTYTTRSDKRLLEWLSTPARDLELGIGAEERSLLSAHIPESHVLRENNVDELARSSGDWFFKPSHGFASHGLLPGTVVGRTRLRRLLKQGASYVAQRTAPKQRVETHEGVSLWTDLRVWAYRGERYMLSGRASLKPDRLDLSPPGGWLPTYALSR